MTDDDGAPTAAGRAFTRQLLTHVEDLEGVDLLIDAARNSPDAIQTLAQAVEQLMAILSISAGIDSYVRTQIATTLSILSIKP